MKYIYALITVFILSSCYGTKQVKNDTAKQESKIEQIATSDLPEVAKTEIEAPKEVLTTSDITEISEENKINKKTRVEPREFKQELTLRIIPFHQMWDDLLQKHVSDKGNVNYKNFKTNRKDLLSYIAHLSKFMPTKDWSKEDKLAYWTNAYNALTVDLILRNYPIKSIKDIKDPWDQRLWKLGSKLYSLNEIEHQILRKMKEPRIHFGIVCASYSCPKLLNKAYTAADLESQLTQVTKDFLMDPERNNISEKSIKLSKIFKWFAKDFKTEGSLIDFLNKYSDISISKNAKKSYKDYNWSLNR